jgi:Holliday junction resolvasome RuvABC endonuclease subunit
VRLLAIDPSINETGWAVAEGQNIVASGVLRAVKHENNQTLPSRILACAERLDKLIKEHEGLGLIVIEISGKLTYQRYRNQTRGQGIDLKGDSLHKLSMAVGAYVIMASLNGIPVVAVEAIRWKSFYRDGRKMPDKEDMKRMASQLTGIKITDHNQADAIVMGSWSTHYTILPLLMAEARQ